MAQIKKSYEHSVVEQHTAAIKGVQDVILGNVAIGNSDMWQQIVEVTTSVESIGLDQREVFERYEMPWIATPTEMIHRSVTERRAKNDGELDLYRSLGKVTVPEQHSLSSEVIFRKRREYSLLQENGFYVPGFSHAIKEVTAIGLYDSWRYFWEPDADVINFYNTENPADPSTPLDVEHVLFVHEPALELRVDAIQRHFLSLAHRQGFSKSDVRLSAYFDVTKQSHLPWERDPFGLNLEEIWVHVSGKGVDFQNNLPLHREMTICTTDLSLPVMFNTDVECETPYGLPESVYHNEGIQPIATYEMVKFSGSEVFHETNNEATLRPERLQQILQLAHECISKL